MQSFSPELISDRTNSFDLEDDALLEEEDIPFEDEDSTWDNFEDEDTSDFEDPSPINLSHSSSQINRKIKTLDFQKIGSLQPEIIILLWPVYLWRVAAPTATERKVNFLILACIRLAEAGVRTISDQARYLALSKDLVSNILNEAQSNKYLDEKYRITPKGEDLLASEGIENKTNTQYGWILQEAVSGDILPFFHADKPDKVTISLQNKTTLSIPVLFPAPERPHKPSELSLIAERLKTYYKLKKEDPSEVQNLIYWNSEDDLKNVETDSVGFSIEKEDLPIKEATHQVVRVLSKRPDRYDLVVRVRLDGTADGSFSVMCPFGLPDSMRWMRLFHYAANQNQEVKQILEGIQAQNREAWKQKQPPDLDPVELSREAYSRLIYEIGKPLDSTYEATWKELQMMMQSKILLERGFDQADSTITRVQRVLEQLMITLIKAEPVSEEVISLYNKKGDLPRCISDTVTACGSTSVPPWITRPHIQEIKQIIMNVPRNSLLAYVSTFLFIASRKGKTFQILKSVFNKNQSFLDEMYRVATIRNALGAHAGGDRSIGNDYISNQANELVEIVFRNVCLLINS